MDDVVPRLEDTPDIRSGFVGEELRTVFSEFGGCMVE